MRVLVVLCCVLLFAASAYAGAVEHRLHPIPLGASHADRSWEFSGLAWCGNELVFLPQFPERAGRGLPVATRADVLARLPSDNREVQGGPLSLGRLELDVAGVPGRIAGYEGFEAMVFSPDGAHAWFAIEARERGHMWAYVVRALRTEAGYALQPDTLAEVPLPVNARNMAVESLLLEEDHLLAFFEANGRNVVDAPVCWRYSLDLQTVEQLPMAHVEYRLTDVTQADADDTFWALNFYWPGERKVLQPAAEPNDMATPSTPDATHAMTVVVERAVRLRYTSSPDPKVERVPGPPVWFKLEHAPRNIEGVAWVQTSDADWLLMVTDKFPASFFGAARLPKD